MNTALRNLTLGGNGVTAHPDSCVSSERYQLRTNFLVTTVNARKVSLGGRRGAAKARAGIGNREGQGDGFAFLGQFDPSTTRQTKE
ncbi:MAG: hypothetical protein ACJA09_001771 [Alcanivorax sp.]